MGFIICTGKEATNRYINRTHKESFFIDWLGVEDYSVRPCTPPLWGQLHCVPLFTKLQEQVLNITLRVMA